MPVPPSPRRQTRTARLEALRYFVPLRTTILHRERYGPSRFDVRLRTSQQHPNGATLDRVRYLINSRN